MNYRYNTWSNSTNGNNYGISHYCDSSSTQKTYYKRAAGTETDLSVPWGIEMNDSTFTNTPRRFKTDSHDYDLSTVLSSDNGDGWYASDFSGAVASATILNLTQWFGWYMFNYSWIVNINFEYDTGNNYGNGYLAYVRHADSAGRKIGYVIYTENRDIGGGTFRQYLQLKGRINNTDTLLTETQLQPDTYYSYTYYLQSLRKNDTHARFNYSIATLSSGASFPAFNDNYYFNEVSYSSVDKPFVGLTSLVEIRAFVYNVHTSTKDLKAYLKRCNFGYTEDVNSTFTSAFYSIYRRKIHSESNQMFAGYNTYIASSTTELKQFIGQTAESGGNVSRFDGVIIDFASGKATSVWNTYVSGILTTKTTVGNFVGGNWSVSIEFLNAKKRLTVSVGNYSYTSTYFVPAYIMQYTMWGTTTNDRSTEGLTISFNYLDASFINSWNFDRGHSITDTNVNTTAFMANFDNSSNAVYSVAYSRISKDFKAIAGVWSVNYTNMPNANDYYRYTVNVAEFNNYTYSEYTTGYAPGVGYHVNRRATTAKVLKLSMSLINHAVVFTISEYDDIVGSTINYLYRNISYFDAADIAEVSFRIYVTSTHIVCDTIAANNENRFIDTFKVARSINSQYFALSTTHHISDNFTASAQIKDLQLIEEIQTEVIPDLVEPIRIDNTRSVASSMWNGALGIFEGLVVAIISFFAWLLKPVFDFLAWIWEIIVNIFDELVALAGTIITWLIAEALKLLKAILDALKEFLNSIGLGWLIDGFFSLMDVIFDVSDKMIEWFLLFLNPVYISIIMLVLLAWIVILPGLQHPNQPGEYIDGVINNAKTNILPFSILGNSVIVPIGAVVFIYIFVIILGVL